MYSASVGGAHPLCICHRLQSASDSGGSEEVQGTEVSRFEFNRDRSLQLIGFKNAGDEVQILRKGIGYL